ncbi:class I tRNA ligase family protein, partial [archaeon]|nr:class I tRNA ligase family protein [archaeon]
TEYYETFQYRKATIELRSLFDLIEKGSSKKTYEKFLKLLSPICPHITEELWEKLGNKEFISKSEWPSFDEDKLKVKKKEINLNEKVIDLIKPHLEKLSFEKVYLYVIPFETSKLDKGVLEKELGKETIIYSVKDEGKYDPEGKAKKARPGQPAFFLE